MKGSPKGKCLDLLSNSLNLFLKEMYRDQSGEFVCGYWGLKGQTQDNGGCRSQSCHGYRHSCSQLPQFTQTFSPHPSVSDGFNCTCFIKSLLSDQLENQLSIHIVN